jgi:nitroimidazol reductase NimA-like FMN-containing flavoprotein (pyridoxamine 5'-phosphate oxidase superfamily)
MLERMMALARQNDICVLATASDNKPHCSLMAYVTDEACREIIMVTHRNTQKFENLKKNPAVSILIDTRRETIRQNVQALTIEGYFEATDDSEAKKSSAIRLLDAHPHLREFIGHPQAEIIRIRIQSFLLLDGLMQSHFEKV